MPKYKKYLYDEAEAVPRSTVYYNRRKAVAEIIPRRIDTQILQDNNNRVLEINVSLAILLLYCFINFNN